MTENSDVKVGADTSNVAKLTVQSGNNTLVFNLELKCSVLGMRLNKC